MTAPFTPLPDWVPLEPFLANLRRAGRGVVRVDIGPEGRTSCTGWMLTDSLVVVPSFVLGDDPAAGVVCRLPGLSEAASAHVEFRPAEDAPGARVLPALLRLAEAFGDRAQGLHVLSPRPDEPLLLVHYPLLAAEAQLSYGHLLGMDDAGLVHDADSAAGSSGGPVLSAETGLVLGMHSGKIPVKDSGSLQGRALPLAALLEALQPGPVWAEIAGHHRLAAVGSAEETAAAPPSGYPSHAAPPVVQPAEPPPPQPQAPDAALLRAALTWTVDPKSLPAVDRERLQPLVAEPDDPVWSLPPEERQRLIAAAGTLGALRAARTPATDGGPADRTVDRILAGGPYDLAGVPDAATVIRSAGV